MMTEHLMRIRAEANGNQQLIIKTSLIKGFFS